MKFSLSILLFISIQLTSTSLLGKSRTPSPTTIAIGEYLEDEDYIKLQDVASKWVIPTHKKSVSKGKAWLAPAVFSFNEDFELSLYQSIAIPDLEINIKTSETPKRVSSLSSEIPDDLSKMLESSGTFRSAERGDRLELVLRGSITEAVIGKSLLNSFSTSVLQAEFYVLEKGEKVGVVQINTTEIKGWTALAGAGKLIEGGIKKKIIRKLTEIFGRLNNGERNGHCYDNRDAMFYVERSKYME